MGDCAGPRHRPTRSRRDRRTETHGEQGFTLIEVVIAVSLLMIMMVPFASAFISSLGATANSHSKEVAVMLADTALDQAKAIDATREGGANLVVGRYATGTNNATAEWNSPAPGVSGILADTQDVFDTNAADIAADVPATLPTTAQSQTVGGQTFHVYYYVGTCWEPAYNSGGASSNTCTNTQTPPSGDYQMYRTIVDVTWSAPSGGCGPGCYYVTSTLISGTVDPAFDVNPVLPYVTSANTTTFIVGAPGSFQVTTDGFPPPTYTDTRYGNGACTPSTLPGGVSLSTTGLLSGTPVNGSVGTYTVCVNATNTGGTGFQTLTLTVVKSTPTITATGPATVIDGTVIPASSISATFSGGSAPTGTITYAVFGPQVSAPPTCTIGGTSLGTATATAAGDANPYHPSAGFTPTVAGDYWLYSSYAGDANNFAATNCGAGMSYIAVGLASPTLVATGPATWTIGTAAIPASSVTGTISGGSTPAGTITYTVFGPSTNAPTTCTTGGTSLGTATALGNNTYHPTSGFPGGGFTPTSAGDYWWYASYTGDVNNNPATGTCGAAMPEMVVPVKVAMTAPISGTVTSAVTALLPSTPASGATMLVLIYAEGNAAAPTISSIGGGPNPALTVSPTLIAGDSPATNYKEWAYWVPANGTGTKVLVTLTSNAIYLHVDVIVLAGNNTSTILAQTAGTNTGTSATPTATLASTPASGDLEVALNGAGGNDLGVGATPLLWSSISNANGPNYGVSSYYTATNGSTSQQFPFTTSVSWATIALDIQS